MFSKIKEWFQKRKMIDVSEFAHRHRHMLVIVCDPKDDTMFMSYRDKQVCGKFSSMEGTNEQVVKKVLKHSQFKKYISKFLGGIIDALQCPLDVGNSFYSFIDAGLFRISKILRCQSDK